MTTINIIAIVLAIVALGVHVKDINITGIILGGLLCVLILGELLMIAPVILILLVLAFLFLKWKKDHRKIDPFANVSLDNLI